MSGAELILQIGVDHHGAPAELLDSIHERLQHPVGDPRSVAGGVGSVGLATCHRVELYCEGLAGPRAVELYRTWIGAPRQEFGLLLPHLQVRVGSDAGRHLLRVAAGLESAVLGEDQILAQTREAYRVACSRGEAGPLLHRLFHAAFRAGKRVRAETALGQGLRSLAGAAVAAIARELGTLERARVLVIGTGEMARLAAARLVARGAANVVVASRTPERAETLAAELGGEACPWEWRRAALGRVDAAVCATRSEEPAIRASLLDELDLDPGRRLVVVDLGAPRSVETPESAGLGVRVIDLATLSEELRADAAQRAVAVRDAEAIVDAELDSWLGWVEARREGVVGCRESGRREKVG